MKAILTYHSIDPSGSPISISKEQFTRHVEWLASGRVRVTTIDELLKLPDSADAVALTFDDGFRNFAETAAPLLAEHRLPATVFIVTDRVGGTNAWDGVPDPGIPMLPLMHWRDLEPLTAQGVTIGSHTRTHRKLATLGVDQLTEEICGSAHEIERRIGRAPVGLAYPYGSVNEKAASLVRGAFPWGCTTELHALRESEERDWLPRLDMYYFRDRGRLESWGTARFTYYLKLRSHARRFRQRWAESHGAR